MSFYSQLEDLNDKHSDFGKNLIAVDFLFFD